MSCQFSLWEDMVDLKGLILDYWLILLCQITVCRVTDCHLSVCLCVCVCRLSYRSQFGGGFGQ